MAQVLSQGYDAQACGPRSFHELGQVLGLDALLIERQHGLERGSPADDACSGRTSCRAAPRPAEFEGAGVTVQVARQLEVPFAYYHHEAVHLTAPCRPCGG